MFQDILRESPIYQEIIEQGRDEERQQELLRQRQTLTSFVQRHFSEITALAVQQAGGITDPEILQTAILRLLDARTVEEARQILLGINQNETRH